MRQPFPSYSGPSTDGVTKRGSMSLRGRHRLDAVDATLKTKTPSQHMYLKSFSQAAWNIVEITRLG